MKQKQFIKRGLAAILSATMAVSLAPSMPIVRAATFVAGQHEVYVDGAPGKPSHEKTDDLLTAKYGDIIKADVAVTADKIKEGLGIAMWYDKNGDSQFSSSEVIDFQSTAEKVNTIDADIVTLTYDTTDKIIPIDDTGSSVNDAKKTVTFIYATKSGDTITWKNDEKTGSGSNQVAKLNVGKKTVTGSASVSITSRAYDTTVLDVDDVVVSDYEINDIEDADNEGDLEVVAKSVVKSDGTAFTGTGGKNAGSYNCMVKLGIQKTKSAATDLTDYYKLGSDIEEVAKATIVPGTIDSSKLHFIDNSGKATDTMSVDYNGTDKSLVTDGTNVYMDVDGTETKISSIYGSDLGTISFTYSDGKKDLASDAVISEPGTYKVKMSIAKSTNYNAVEAFDIGKLVIKENPLSALGTLKIELQTPSTQKFEFNNGTLEYQLYDKNNTQQTISGGITTQNWYIVETGESLGTGTTLSLNNKKVVGHKIGVEVKNSDKTGSLVAETDTVISAKPVTLGAIDGNTNKVYDGTNVAEVKYVATGAGASDRIVLTGTYAGKNVGTNQAITLDSYKIVDNTGAELPEYKLADNFEYPESLKGDITTSLVTIDETGLRFYYIDPEVNDSNAADKIKNADNLSKIQIVGTPKITGIAEGETAELTIKEVDSSGTQSASGEFTTSASVGVVTYKVNISGGLESNYSGLTWHNTNSGAINLITYKTSEDEVPAVNGIEVSSNVPGVDTLDQAGKL